MFLPVRGDGLKSKIKKYVAQDGVSPRKGRWIEIRKDFPDFVIWFVSPRKGRWIEIVKNRSVSALHSVSPRKGRWIEINIKLDTAVIMVSPRKGRWIEIMGRKDRGRSRRFLPVRGDGLKYLKDGMTVEGVSFSP